jgi:hypothetical protein
MNKIKFLKNNKIILNNILYKPHTICELADTRFGQVDSDGFSYITQWFNYKGFTYVAE